MLGGVPSIPSLFQKYSLEFYSVCPIWILVPDIAYAIEFIFWEKSQNRRSYSYHFKITGCPTVLLSIL